MTLLLALISSLTLVLGQQYSCSDLVYDSDGWRLCKIFENIQNMPSYWLNTTNVCDWNYIYPDFGLPDYINEGVQCSDGYVTKVDFCFTSRLEGLLNFTVPWPSAVEDIHLRGCNFANSITNVNFSIFPTTLERLDIASTDMTGTPNLCTMKHLTNLEMLLIAFNEFSGTLDFSCLTNLENLWYLYLTGDNWSGSYNLSVLPSSLGYLRFQDLPNVDPQPFPDLSRFTFGSLYLENINMVGTINPNFIPNGENPSSGNWYFGHNRLSGTIKFSDWPNIGLFRLESNQFSGTLDWENSGRFGNHIWLQNNQFSGTIDTSFLSDRLYDLFLQNNNFVGPIDFTSLPSSAEAIIDTDVLCDAEIYCGENEHSITRSAQSCDGPDGCASTCRCEPGSLTVNPTIDPTSNPTQDPNMNPTENPTLNPTLLPTIMPSKTPTTDLCFSILTTCINVCKEEPCDEIDPCVRRCGRSFSRCFDDEVVC